MIGNQDGFDQPHEDLPENDTDPGHEPQENPNGTQPSINSQNEADEEEGENDYFSYELLLVGGEIVAEGGGTCENCTQNEKADECLHPLSPLASVAMLQLFSILSN